VDSHRNATDYRYYHLNARYSTFGCDTLLSVTTWLTVKQLAVYLQISTAKVYELARAGEIPRVRVGNQWRFDQEEVDRRLRDQMREGKS
jgi:excisionase family DNA binding protein